MGTITIPFEGICTQVKLGTPIDAALHVSVLVHAENGDNIHGCTIPPHDAFSRSTHSPSRTCQDDFFLHYLTAKNLPDDAKIPSSGTPARYEGLGPSCSNSIYP